MGFCLRFRKCFFWKILRDSFIWWHCLSSVLVMPFPLTGKTFFLFNVPYTFAESFEYLSKLWVVVPYNLHVPFLTGTFISVFLSHTFENYEDISQRKNLSKSVIETHIKYLKLSFWWTEKKKISHLFWILMEIVSNIAPYLRKLALNIWTYLENI